MKGRLVLIHSIATPAEGFRTTKLLRRCFWVKEIRIELQAIARVLRLSDAAYSIGETSDLPASIILTEQQCYIHCQKTSRRNEHIEIMTIGLKILMKNVSIQLL